MMRHIMKNAILFFLVCISTCMPANSTGLSAFAKASADKVSLGGYGFIENKGQIIDQNNKPNNEVLYLYNGNGLHVQLRQNGFSYEVIKTEKTPKALSDLEIESLDKFHQDSFDYTYKIHRIDISFEGGNKNAQISPFEPSSDYINYYTGSQVRAPLAGALPPPHNPNPENNGITHIHHYKKILYTNIYPNIDVEFILNSANPAHPFKYNFIIHPGGNINDIKLKFLGATNTSLTEDGHITIETAYGNIDESIPYSYQINNQEQQQTVLSKFRITEPEAKGQKLTANTFGIEVKNYDPTKTLVIDPAPWATYFGGSGDDYSIGIAVDGSGNIVITGYTSSISGIASSGAYQTSFGGAIFDAYIAKFNALGARQWATYYGGSSYDQGMGITADGSGNIIITGLTSSSSGIASSGAYQTSISGTEDAFIAKFNSSGARLWATYYGGSMIEQGWGIGVDGSGNIVITGYTESTSGIATSGAHQTSYGGSGDAFIAKFNAAGVHQWGTYYCGSGHDYGYGIAVEGGGNIVITGKTTSTSGIATSGAYQTSIGGSYDAFIAKFNASGVRGWATYYGGSVLDFSFRIAVDGTGNIVTTGYTESTSGIATSGAYQTSKGGGSSDAFIAKFNATGARQWATYYGGSSYDQGLGIAADGSGNIVITGYTASISGIATSGVYQTSYGGGTYDAFIAKFNASGARQWATYYGGSGVEKSWGIAADDSGNIVITGATTSTSGISTSSAYQTSNGGFDDAFIFSLPVSPGLPSITNNTISSDQGICSGTIPASFIGSIPSGGDGNFIYTWLSSTTSSTTGYTVASGTNNAINYFPPPLSSNTWYKRVVSSGGYFDTSNLIAITVGSKLNVGFTVNQMIQCIKTNNFIFTDTTTASGTITRLWDFGNGTTSTLMNPNISYNFNIANAYWVKLESSINGACVDSAKQRVFVISNPAPTGAITGNTVVGRLSTHTYSVPATMGSSYQWIFSNGNGNSTSNNINIKWNTIGTIDLKVVEFSGGGCAGDTVYQSISINPGVGLEGFEGNDEMIIYPNPSDGLIRISRTNLPAGNHQNSFLQIIVYDMLGKQVYQNFVSENKDIIEIDISELHNGIYSLQLVEPDGNTYIKKLQLIK